MINVGSIVFLKDICFKPTDKNKYTVDHAHNKGRPCLLIGEDEENMYFLPFAHCNPKFIGNNTTFTPNSNNNFTKVSSLNFKTLVKKPISFYEEAGFLTDFEMYKVFKTMNSFIKEIRNPDEEIMKNIAIKYLSNKKYFDKDNKKEIIK